MEIEIIKAIYQGMPFDKKTVKDVYLCVQSYDKTIEVLTRASQGAIDPYDIIKAINGFDSLTEPKEEKATEENNQVTAESLKDALRTAFESGQSSKGESPEGYEPIIKTFDEFWEYVKDDKMFESLNHKREG